MATRQIVTRAQLRAAAKNRLANSPFWADAEVNDYINEAIRVFQDMTAYWRGRLVMNTVPHLPYYSIPGTITSRMRIDFNNHPLIQGNVFEWDNGDPDWESREGQPQEWAPIDVSLIAIRPADPMGNNSLTVDGIDVAPILNADGGFIDLGQEDFNALLDYIQHIASFKEGGQEFQSTMPLFSNFVKNAALHNEKLRASSIYRNATGVVAEDEKARREVPTRELATVGER